MGGCAVHLEGRRGGQRARERRRSAGRRREVLGRRNRDGSRERRGFGATVAIAGADGATIFIFGRKNKELLEMDYFLFHHTYLRSWQTINLKTKCKELLEIL